MPGWRVAGWLPTKCLLATGGLARHHLTVPGRLVARWLPTNCLLATGGLARLWCTTSPLRAGMAGGAVAAYELPTGHGRASFGSGTRQMPAFLTPF